mmetsp:Transcript_51156/g.119912  ORF Transcript_51156/g.119912 Transcript_51156/m.119912 type:complete len:238 (+) Transcript_51156:725-1438(+)
MARLGINHWTLDVATTIASIQFITARQKRHRSTTTRTETSTAKIAVKMKSPTVMTRLIVGQDDCAGTGSSYLSISQPETIPRNCISRAMKKTFATSSADSADSKTADCKKSAQRSIAETCSMPSRLRSLILWGLLGSKRRAEGCGMTESRGILLVSLLGSRATRGNGTSGGELPIDADLDKFRLGCSLCASPGFTSSDRRDAMSCTCCAARSCNRRLNSSEHSELTSLEAFAAEIFV